MAFNLNFSGFSKWGDRLGLKNPRPPFEKFYIYGLLFFIAYLMADFTATSLREKMLPIGGITRSKSKRRSNIKKKTASVFTSVKDKNIFNSDHFIPESLGEQSKGEEGEDNSAPVLTSLPLSLVGTIIHVRRELSVATIQVKGKDIQAVVAGDTLESMAKIRDVLRNKVIFRNLRNRKLEYVEIQEENKITMGVSGKKGTSQPVVNQPAKTNFTFKRSDINKYLENLPRVLQDAKAVPYIAPGSGGEVSGFKLVAIKSGSIYEKLGLKRGDIIKGVNGEPVDSPQKAMELYQALKSSDQIQLDVNRSGSNTTLNYSLE